MKPTKTILTLILAVFLGCSTQEANLMVDKTSATESPQVTFKEPGILKKYKAFYVPPITIYGNDSGRLMPAQDHEIDRLAHLFRKKIISALGSRHTQFNQPAKGVAIIDVKLTNVWSNKALEALRPGIIIPNNLGAGATMQAEFYDSVNDEVIATVWDSRAGKRTGYLSGLTKWSGAEAAFDEWSIMLRDSIARQGY